MTDERDQPLHIRNAKALAEANRALKEEVAQLDKKVENLERQIGLISNQVNKLEQEAIMRMVQSQGSGPTS